MAGVATLISAVPKDTVGRLFEVVQGNNEEMLGVEASLDANATWRLMFRAPPTIPSGILKLLITARANTATGAAKINPAWIALGPGDNPDTATPTAEGTQTITWTTGDEQDYKELKVTLDAATAPTANQIILVNLVFETASWGVTVISAYHASVIWED